MHELGGVLEKVLLQIEAGVNKDQPDSPATHYIYIIIVCIYILIYVQICYSFMIYFYFSICDL